MVRRELTCRCEECFSIRSLPVMWSQLAHVEPPRKCPFPKGGFRHSPNAWFHGPIRVHVAYGTSIGSSVLEGQGAELRMFSMRSLPG